MAPNLNLLLLRFLILAATFTAFCPSPLKAVSLPTKSAAVFVDSTVADEWYLPTSDKKALLFVREVGHGTPVVVLHGGYGAEYSYLEDAVQGLTGKYRFIFYDQRGSLRSPCKLEDVTYHAHIEDLETLRKALNLDKMNIFAHSMGTMLAASYMKEYPGRVGKVVLAGCLPMKSGRFLGPGYEGMVAMNDGAQIMRDRPEVKAQEALEKGRPEGAPQKATHLWRIQFGGTNIYHADRWRATKGGMVFYNAAAGDKASSEMFKELTNDFDFSNWFIKHPYQATVISGDHDYADYENRFFSVFRKEAPIRYTIIKQAGHNMWIDDPKGFQIALDGGLRS